MRCPADSSMRIMAVAEDASGCWHPVGVQLHGLWAAFWGQCQSTHVANP